MGEARWSEAAREAIAAALDRIERSPPFASSARQQRLLRYLVDETLAGRGGRLTQTAIAIDVLERDERFDPATDSVVRVEAGRLRAKLREYYATDGTDEAVRIDLPRGKYEAEITVPGLAKPATQPTPIPVTDEQPAVAVLPFVNMSADPEQEYFSDGISEEILNALTRVKGLHVVARTSAFAFKHHEANIEAIGNALHVNHVIEGSVRKAGNRLRITAQLISVADGYHVWSDTYDREFADVFAIQEDIARAVVGALRVELGMDTSEPLVKPSTENLNAYDLFLRGRSVMHQWWSPRGFEEAAQLFRQAIELEPDYVEAHGGLAFALTLSRLYQRYYEIEAQARASLQRALELDPNQHWALFAQGYLAPPDWKLAGQLFERAMEASGRAPLMTPHCVRNYFNIIERFAEAHALLDEAQERDPLSPLLPFVRARTLYAQGEFEAAVRACERSLELETHIYPSLYVVGELYARLDAVGRAEETVVRLREFNGPEDPFALYIEGLVHLAKGQSGEASEDRDHLIRNWAQVSYVPPTLIARLSIAMGDIDAGMHWFETAWHQRDYFLCDLRAQYRNEPSVWNNPQCQKLARLMNLDDESLRNL